MDRIAVIGLSCLFPGATTPEKYFENLLQGNCLISQATAQEMGADPDVFYAAQKGQVDKYYCLNGGYIRDFSFNTDGYQISPEILSKLDPIYQWSLYTAREALRDSGYASDRAILSNCGVIIGNLSFPTRSSHPVFSPVYTKVLSAAVQDLLQDDSFCLENVSLTPDLSPVLKSKSSGYPAALISQALSLSSIHFSLDAACASSLYAIKLAVAYLLSGKADLMLAGAVSAADPLFIQMGFSIFQAFSEDGKSAPLNQASGGLVAGEGAGMVVLKRYEDAVRDGDRIYAIISGIGLSNDGAGKFVLNPNQKGQVLAFERAYANTGIDPACIDYVECHATGTPVGDIAELNSMAAFFGRYDASPRLGSVKSNLGHLLTAAGIAGLIKVILSMQEGVIPSTINVDQPLCSSNGKIGGDQIVRTPTAWTQQDAQKRAGISAFGFGGCNAHLILESAADLPQTAIDLRLKNFSPARLTPLAITGMDGLFGGCKDLDAFDRTIYDGEQHFIPVPPQRWQGVETQSDLLKRYGFEDGKAPLGAYIQDFELDFLRFKIPPRDEDQLIPQQLLMLKVADNAITDAGLKPGQNVAVLIAMGTELALHQHRGRVDLSWQIQVALEQAGIVLPPDKIAELEAIAKDSLHPPAQVNRYTSFIGNIMASRISALRDFSGPSFTVSAEENSVFRALEIAQLLLSQSEVEAVVVGAVDLAGGFEHVLLQQQFAPVNQGNPTLSFDQQANGWLVGEAAGAVVLKRQDIAKQQNDRIYAVIETIAFAQDHNRANSLPQSASPEAVYQACQTAFERSGVRPREIGYLEVFGSGIAEADAAEIEGLLRAYRKADDLVDDAVNGDRENTEISQAKILKDKTEFNCCIGSVKANVGYAYAASGIASLIKTALCLYHRYIPATPQWSAPKNLASWQGSPFYVAPESRTWFLESGVTQRIAAINGLGMDGLAAHLILTENINSSDADAIDIHQRPNRYLEGQSFRLFLLAANDQSELLEKLAHFKQQVQTSQNLVSLSARLYETFQADSQATYRLAIVGYHQDELLREIDLAENGIGRAFAQQQEWKTPLGSYFTAQPLGQQGKIAFVYPGMGSADIELGKDIFRLFPKVYEQFSNLTEDVSQVLHQRLMYPRSLEKLSSQDYAARIRQFFDNGVAMCQSGTSLATLYTLVLRGIFDVQPQVAFGYSLGEASSMFFALDVWRDRHHTYAKSAAIALETSPLFKTELCGSCTAGREFWQLPDPVTESEQDKFWASYLVQAPVFRVIDLLQSESQVYLTFINHSEEAVIAGNPAACLNVIQKLNCSYLPMNFDSVLHCEIARTKYDDLIALHTIPIQKRPEIQFYSSIEGTPIKLEVDTLAHNSATLCCQTVDFPKLVQSVYEDGTRIFIEVGAKSHCTRCDKILEGSDHLAAAINQKGVDDHTSLVRLLAKLVSHNISVNLFPLYPATASGTAHAKSVVKKVVLGGKDIYSSILNAENQAKFQEQSFKQKVFFRNINLPKQEAFLLSGHQQNLKIAQLLITKFRQFETAGQSVDQVSVTQPAQGDRSLHPANVDQKGYTKSSNIVWDEAALLEFAQGNIESAFGSDYSIIDTYPRRVRLPMPPYLLVSRVTKISAEKGSFKPSSITTEYDIPLNAWYSVDGQIPWSVAVESGQCDLLLISYLGIDFENKGNLVYRLLDCTLTFLADLPKEGETLRYDISINSFARSGSNLLFFFSYECFVGEKMVIKMDGGCAGFFSDEQLDQGKGIIYTEKELAALHAIEPRYFDPLLICQKSSFDESDMQHLIDDNLAACFGDHYNQYGLNPSLRLPPKAILMIDRVPSVDPMGGAWGLGLIIGEKSLAPEHWYFPCHFKDDQVMAGSLMAEGCGQLLQFYLLYLGLHTCTRDARFQPISGLPQVVRCRGQVTPTSATLTYRMEVKDIGTTPQPYVICDVEIILNDKTVVHFQDLGLQLSEKNGDEINAETHPVHQRLTATNPKKLSPSVLISEAQVHEFCLGDVSKCFGAEYAIYDSGKIFSSRMPNTHLNFVHRVLDIQGDRHKLKKGSSITAEYDVPDDPWYYRQNSVETIPYSILMEIGLQPCGFLSAYLGSTLIYPNESLYFRNLDGKGHLLKAVDIRGKTITNSATLISSTNVEGIILQSFTFQVSCDNEVFYQGTAAFGHFSPQALANQMGLDQGQCIPPWIEENVHQAIKTIHLEASSSRAQYYQPSPAKPHYRLAQHQLDLLHEVKIVEQGGRYQQGYIYARKAVKPTDWYFRCHFYLDPVMPGSLGVEAMIQAMQVYALELDLGKHLRSPYFTSLPDHTIVWKYRGQIPHGNAEMQVEIHISKVEIRPNKVILIADASLWKNQLRIYEVKDLALCLADRFSLTFPH